MVTTVQLKETTKQLLDTLKAKNNSGSYDSLILQLLKRHYKIQDMFGFTKKKPIKFTKEDEMHFHEV